MMDINTCLTENIDRERKNVYTYIYVDRENRPNLGQIKNKRELKLDISITVRV
jgi:hypothetical protein